MFDAKDGGGLTGDQFERLKGELQDAYAGAGNAGRPMVLEGGLKWQSMSLSPADMDFAGLKAAAARDIALAFGVPPMLLGLRDRTFAIMTAGIAQRLRRNRPAVPRWTRRRAPQSPASPRHWLQGACLRAHRADPQPLAAVSWANRRTRAMNRTLALALPAALALTACQTVDELPTERLGQATLRLANGLPAGTAQLLASGSQVNISIAVAGISQGVHGTHLHVVGSCEAPDFTSAGGHLNPDSRQHGHENPAGAHMGDLPNVTVGGAGAGTVSATLRGSREEVLARLFDSDGTAVVVHATADDYRTDPSGNAGGRIACGVLTRT